MRPIVYRDGIQIIAVGDTYADIHFGINRTDGSVDAQLVLSQIEARELAGALAWIISEVDAQHGRDSFKPRFDRRYAGLAGAGVAQAGRKEKV